VRSARSVILFHRFSIGGEVAIGQALEEFSEVAVIASNFREIFKWKRKRWMMRFATIMTACLFMVAVLAYSMWPERARLGSPDLAQAKQVAGSQDNDSSDSSDSIPVASQPQRPPSLARQVLALNDQIEEKLREMVDLHYKEVAWEEVVSDLRDRFGLNVIVDMSAQEDLANSKVVISVSDVPLEIGLVIMLQKFNCSVVVKDGVLRVISIDSETDPQFLTLRIYDCQELVRAIDLDFSTGSEEYYFLYDSKQAMGQGGGMVGGASEGNPQGHQSQEGGPVMHRKTLRKDTVLLQSILISVNPDSWTENGGVGTARFVNGNLVVVQTRSAHRDLEMFLELLKDQFLK